MPETRARRAPSLVAAYWSARGHHLIQTSMRDGDATGWQEDVTRANFLGMEIRINMARWLRERTDERTSQR